MSKMILLNTVRVQDSMVMYALSGGTLTVMLQYLNSFAANNVLLTVVGKTYAELLAETGFIEVARTGGTYIVNPYRVMTINNNVITFDNGMQITTTDSDSAVANLINAIPVPIRQANEDIVSDGTGVITLAHNYTSGSCKVYLRGALVRKADVSETGPDELTLSVSTRSGDFINVQYDY